MAKSKFRILLAQESELGHYLLACSLQSAPMIEIVGKAYSGQETIDMAGQCRPDAIVTESSGNLSGGFNAFRIIRSEYPGVEIIELAGFDHPEFRQQAAQAGTGNRAGGMILSVVLAAVFPLNDPR
jgi:two-component system, NarL family, nitrate/nitrite response regulator NarL